MVGITSCDDEILRIRFKYSRLVQSFALQQGIRLN